MTIPPHPHMIRWPSQHILIWSDGIRIRNILPLSCASSPPWRSPRLSLQRKSSYSFFSFLWRPGCKIQDFQKILGAGFLGEAGASWRQQGQVQRATGGCLAYPNHSYSGLNTAPAHSPIKSQELEMFLAALAALYLTLVSQWVSQSVPLLNLTQRVTLDTWDPSDI